MKLESLVIGNHHVSVNNTLSFAHTRHTLEVYFFFEDLVERPV